MKPEPNIFRYWPTIRILATVVTVLAILGCALTYLARQQEQETYSVTEEIYSLSTRDFTLIPFDILDATHICEQRAESKYGDKLALSYVDEQSTRIDQNTGVFKIFMVAYVGDLDDYQETAVHCFVDPYRYTLTHFRTIKISDVSLAARVFNFFK